VPSGAATTLATARSPRGAASSGTPHFGFSLGPGVRPVEKARPARRLAPAAAWRGRWKPFKRGRGVRSTEENSNDDDDGRRSPSGARSLRFRCGLQVS